MDRSPQGLQTELAASTSVTRTEVISSENITSDPPVLRLQLQKPKSDKKVAWRSGTVDNENMGKKKSKCCCVYKKPLAFGESSSESEDECEHCYGHVEKKNRKPHLPNNSGPKEDDCQ